MYYHIRKDWYWPALAVDCYATVRNCAQCAKNRIKLRKNVEPLQLFPATEPLASVSIDILGEFITTPRRNKYLLVISDRFTKLTKTVPIKKISAAEVAKSFVDNWVFNYGPHRNSSRTTDPASQASTSWTYAAYCPSRTTSQPLITRKQTARWNVTTVRYWLRCAPISRTTQETGTSTLTRSLTRIIVNRIRQQTSHHSTWYYRSPRDL